MDLPVFQEHSTCTRCALHQTAKCPGMATRPSDLTPPRPTKSRALLVVGEAPGRNEDLKRMCFVGQSGGFLHRVYLGLLRFQDYADIYLTNACRCRPPQNATPTGGQIKACRPYLYEDVATLQKLYPEVIILCTGAAAVESVLDMGLTESFARQGELQYWGWAGTEHLKPCPVFSTYHPINLASKRNPSRIAAIRDHLRLLHAHLTGQPPIPVDTPEVVLCPPVPPYKFKHLALDIETYGAAHGNPPQTCFHPIKSAHYDKPRQPILTVALAWRDPSNNIQTAAFKFPDPEHRNRLLAFLGNLGDDGSLDGMNIKFDLLYLRDADPRFRRALHPGITLVDVSVLNYLHSEQRPERSLKAIAPLLRIAKYDTGKSLKHHRYTSVDDPGLLSYNVKDAVVTLRAVEELEARIRQDYPDSAKLSDYSRWWYSRLLWTCIQMEEDGQAFDQEALDALDFSTVLKAALIWSECYHKYGLVLSGPGSDKAKSELFLRAVEEAGLVGDPRLQLTETEKRISTNKKNATLLLENLDPASQTALVLRKQQEFEGLQKLVTSYTRPMLYGTAKNPVSSRLVPNPVRGRGANKAALIAYPSWFPVPSQFDSGTQGGTLQGRITAKGPALQTLPKHTELGKKLQACFTSRYDPGFLISVDLSQIELRIIALLSGDPRMMEEYQQNIDRHTQTAQEILRHLLALMEARAQDTILLGEQYYTVAEMQEFLASSRPRSYPRFDLFRQAGKHANFLMAYGGQATKLQATINDKLHVVVPLEVCEALIEWSNNRYPGVTAYQEGLVETAKRTGRIALPLTGQSRMFIGSRKAVDETYRNEIVNFPIQTTAANVLLDIQANLRATLNRRRRKVCIGLNIYDALFVDGPMSEYAGTMRAIEKCFSHSEYYEKLQNLLERRVPLGYEINVLVRDSVRPVLHGEPTTSTIAA